MEGIIPLWKPRGLTSHDCVFKLRKILHTKKVGHSGTLDPDVDGVLPICVGKATKVVEYLQDSRKVYEGEMVLGFSTETEDASGEVVAISPVKEAITEEEIDAMMASFIGEITQIPPMYSAVKVNGRRLYDYARAGETVERPIRKADIYDFVRTSTPVYDEETQTQRWRFRVDCGKGTYVRTLAVDTGKQLGFEAHMSELTRTESGGFTSKEAITLEQVAEWMETEQQEAFLYPLERGISMFQTYDLTEDEYSIIRNGPVLAIDYFKTLSFDEPVALFFNQKIVSIYGVHPTKSGNIKPMKVFRND